ncbi:efflux transporter outer membrane subunit [Sandaracinobacteroides hominis]|uniref:efflux transporter outer membrane subunit n=1 Tax=Sandaracinobacteroides hominis TaxID=2780086 RepID=UPI0018F7032C|nr:efflux transporter outer membrane subunit [Sandaracinobacteroides hominis]
MARFTPLALLLLAGCQLAPADVRPEMATPSAYPLPGPAGGTDATMLSRADFFPDPRLRALIDAGLARNRDLAVSSARIAEARGLYRIQDSERLPSLNASATASRSRIVNQGPAYIANYVNVGVAVPAFELDFWGRIRNLSDAARASYLSTIAGERAFRLSLIRSIASAYFALREAEERVALAERTVTSREEGLRIAKRRLDAGVTSALDFRQSESLLTQAETELSALRLARAQAINYLTVLTGGPIAGELPAGLPLAAQKPTQPLAAGLPSALLEARPDIVAAEESLRAARANVGAARAAFYPNISLTGNIGFASAALDDLFDDSGLGWSFGPSISIPIFDWGARKGNLSVARAREDIAVASYEKTVQEAFREVADTLAGRRYLAEEVAAQQRATTAYREIARLARIRYREGVANYLEVLDAERSLFTAEQALITLQRQELDNLAALYAALGGGLGPEPAVGGSS